MEPEVLSPFSGGFEIFGVLLVILAIVVLWSTVKIVPQGMNYTVENFGRYTRTLQPGLHILVPVMERVGHRMNMKEQVLDIPSQDVITRDNAMVRVNGVTFFQVHQRGARRLRGRSARAVDRQPHHDQHPHRHGLDGPRRAACPTAIRSMRGCCKSSTRRRKPGASRSRASRSRTSIRRATSSTAWRGR